MTRKPPFFIMKSMFIGGAEGDRTPDLVIANDALSQLSYCPDEPAEDLPHQRENVKQTED